MARTERKTRTDSVLGSAFQLREREPQARGERRETREEREKRERESKRRNQTSGCLVQRPELEPAAGAAVGAGAGSTCLSRFLYSTTISARFSLSLALAAARSCLSLTLTCLFSNSSPRSVIRPSAPRNWQRTCRPEKIWLSRVTETKWQ